MFKAMTAAIAAAVLLAPAVGIAGEKRLTAGTVRRWRGGLRP